MICTSPVFSIGRTGESWLGRVYNVIQAGDSQWNLIYWQHPPLPPYPSLPSFPSNVYTYTLHIERFHWASLHAHTYIDTNLLGRTSLYLFLLMLSGVLATNWVPALSLEICCSRCGRHKALRHPRESFPYTSTTQANKSKALFEKCRS
jgi:hypothetical protein